MSNTYLKIMCEGCGTQTHTLVKSSIEPTAPDGIPSKVFQPTTPQGWSLSQFNKYNCPACSTLLAQKEKYFP